MTIGLETCTQCSFDLLGAFRRPKYRSMREFAEQEIVIPTGPFANQYFRTERQPFARHWFAACADPQWKEIVATGPSQTGKTLLCFVTPILYHLFELNQDVIAAVPDQDMVMDKWARDIEPVMSKTRYAALMPATGTGSRGGKALAIRFHNGTWLRFLTAGGKDKSRAGFTAPIIAMTETDGFDTRVSTSDEADKITQIEARLRAFLADGSWRIYKECTLTTEEGHTWRRYSEGTASKLMLRCPHCGQFSQPEREHFVGWQHTDNELDAMDAASFVCPQCGETWTEHDRVKANQDSILLHRGQVIEDGRVVGDVPRTTTLGFRWSAVNNLLLSTASLARDEFNASRAEDEDNEERRMCQFVWAIPYRPKDEVQVSLTPDMIARRNAGTPRGAVPDGAAVTVGVDVNKAVLHWTAIAWTTDSRGIVIDYGKTGCKADELGFNIAIQHALKHLHDKLGTLWTKADYRQVYVDSRWETDAVIAGVKALGDKRWRPFFGLGQGHWSKRTYTHPAQRTKQDVWVGERCYERVQPQHRAIAMFADANFWKTWLHGRIALDESQEGAITLFSSMDPGEHSQFAKHLTAEKESQVFERGRGYIKQWDAIRAANHWLDSTYMACVGGHRHGFGARKFTPPARPQTRVAAPSQHGDEFHAPTFER